MARPLRIEFDGAFYHVTSRGDERKEIFKTVADRQRFLEYLSSASTRYGAIIHCYCLMGNHYHLFLQTPHGNLSQIMRASKEQRGSELEFDPITNSSSDPLTFDPLTFDPLTF